MELNVSRCIIILIFILSSSLVFSQDLEGEHSFQPTSTESSQIVSEEEIEATLKEDLKEIEAGRKILEEGEASKFRGTWVDASGGGSQREFNPDISVIFSGDLSYFYNEKDKIPRGELQPTTSGFHLEEVEIGFESNVDPYFRLYSFIGVAQDHVHICEAYFETLQLPLNLQVKFGQFLLPVGRHNPQHAHYWKFVDQPIVVDRFLNGGEGLSSFGGEINLLLPLPWYMKISYVLVKADTGEFPKLPGIDLHSDQRSFGLSPGEEWYNLLHLLRVETFIPFSDTWSMLIGLNGLWGPSGQGEGNRTDIYGVDLFIRYKPVSGSSYFEFWWQSEGYIRLRQFPQNQLFDFGTYTIMAFRVAQRWYLGGRLDYVGGELTRDPNNLTGSGLKAEELRATFGITFQPSEFSLLRLQYNFDKPNWGELDPVHEILLQLQVTIGAHGAHPF